MKVHSTLGNGFQEVIYQRAMSIEMEKKGLSFVREMEMPFTTDHSVTFLRYENSLGCF